METHVKMTHTHNAMRSDKNLFLPDYIRTRTYKLSRPEKKSVVGEAFN